MKRGRPRKFDPSIPAHIDQRKLPKGAYWDRRWRIWTTKTPDGSPTIGDHTATLAHLHTRLEELRDKPTHTLGWLLDQFNDEKNPKFAKLAKATKRDYDYCRKVAREHQTKRGPLTDLPLAVITTAGLQVVVDDIDAQGKPAKANHLLRYLKRAYSWGMQRGKCRENPAKGVEGATELAKFKMPTPEALAAVLAYARERGALQAHTRGSVAAYLWPFMVIAYRVRLRKVEVLTLCERQLDDVGIITARRKGSLDNHVRWKGAPDLRAAVDSARAFRDGVWETRKLPTPINYGDRLLLVGETGQAITESTLDSAWDRLMASAIDAGVITAADYFTPHGLKHRGITDSKNKADGGHATEQMRRRYDHELAVVDPAGAGKKEKR